jgi:hypothetical protein
VVNYDRASALSGGKKIGFSSRSFFMPAGYPQCSITQFSRHAFIATLVGPASLMSPFLMRALTLLPRGFVQVKNAAPFSAPVLDSYQLKNDSQSAWLAKYTLTGHSVALAPPPITACLAGPCSIGVRMIWLWRCSLPLGQTISA